MRSYLDFEKPIAELDGKIKDLNDMDAGEGEGVDVSDEVVRLRAKADKLLADTYAKLSPWQKAQVARHPDRPHFLDYVQTLTEDFTELAGDRVFGEDAAIIGGIGRFRGRSAMFIGHEKGTDTQSRVKRNFGMARPEGYRKAVRLMDIAARFGLPVVTLVDSAGAYPGVGAEERGQAEAIARSTEACLALPVPSVSAIIGEGGSGGAVALATANKVLMLEHSIYTVISPEGCASILWRDAAKAEDAAAALKMTAQDLLKLGVIDAIVEETTGGAQRNPDAAIQAMGDAIDDALAPMEKMKPKKIINERRQKFLDIGRTGL